MARIKWFENEKIVVYIYGELYEKHHERHVLVLKKDEDCQYGFDGQPIKGTGRLKKKSDHDLVSAWILAHSKEVAEQPTNPKPADGKDSLKTDSAPRITRDEIFAHPEEGPRIRTISPAIRRH